MKTTAAAIALSLLGPAPAVSQQIEQAEYTGRRERILAELSDGILLLHARSTEKAMEQPSFVQNASFYYFTGFANQPGAILVLDGPLGEALLFVPPPPLSFGMPVADLVLPPGRNSAEQFGFDSVAPWEEFVPYLNRRMADRVRKLYIDQSRRPEMLGVPEPLWPVAGEKTLWQRSLARAFPEATIESARATIRAMRWVKSPGEIAQLRSNARATAAALLAGMRSVRPGVTQREAEAAVVAGCIAAGAEGPSFWPWMMSGPNGHVGRLVRAFYDYNHLNRVMRAGEVVREDIGCAAGSYGGDVGRTIPVSGFFDAGQRETWNMLIDAYHSGLAAMRAGISIADVMAASRKKISELQPGLQTEQARAAARSLLAAGGMRLWSIHGVGIDSGETPLDVLQAGSVIAFEPMFSAGADAFYLEDMILVTESGHEVLSAGLPYTAEEIEAVMAQGR